MKKAKRKHCGNFKIGVSFDMYGDSKVMEPAAFVWCLKTALKATYKKWEEIGKVGAHKFDIENVRWNEQ